MSDPTVSDPTVSDRAVRDRGGRAAVNAAGLVQGIALVTFPAASGIFTSGSDYGLSSTRTGQQLGNFPQAFSHLALISAAVNLDHQLDHGAGVLPG